MLVKATAAVICQLLLWENCTYLHCFTFLQVHLPTPRGKYRISSLYIGQHYKGKFLICYIGPCLPAGVRKRVFFIVLLVKSYLYFSSLAAFECERFLFVSNAAYVVEIRGGAFS